MGKASRRKGTKKTVPMTPEVRGAISTQLKAFKKKFGRDPGPTDPVFFDPDADTPQPMNPDKYQADMVRAMSKVGVDAPTIYAYQKTGLMASKSNWDLLTPSDRAEWQAAIKEYEEKIASNKQNQRH